MKSTFIAPSGAGVGGGVGGGGGGGGGSGGGGGVHSQYGSLHQNVLPVVDHVMRVHGGAEAFSLVLAVMMPTSLPQQTAVPLALIVPSFLSASNVWASESCTRMALRVCVRYRGWDGDHTTEHAVDMSLKF